MSDKCQRCGVAPRGVTHICPPSEFSGGSPVLAPAVSIPVAHLCQQPVVFGLTSPQQPDWMCGECGRVWRDQISGPVRWWAEIKGPSA